MSDERSLLEGIRVVEVASFVFAPAAGTVMGDFGADVIHVEPPGIGDVYRYLHTLKPLPACEHPYCWILDGRNKRSVALDLKSEPGREALLDLIRSADVFITNYHPSVLEALKLRYEDVGPLNPRMIYAHGTGYGEMGPDAELPGYDATAWWARSGLMDAVRPAGAPPAMATPGMGDHPSAMSVFGAIMLALYDRERTGRGTKVSTSLAANGVWSNSIYVQAALCGAPPFEQVPSDAPPNAVVAPYQTADGRVFLLAMVKEDVDFGGLCRAIERPELEHDPRFAKVPERRAHAAELAAILREAFVTRPWSEWRAAFERHHVTIGLVNPTWEVPDDPQLEAIGVFTEMEHPELGRLRTVDSPIQVRGARKRPPSVAPEIGQHTAEVLRELGWSDERLRSLGGDGS